MFVRSWSGGLWGLDAPRLAAHETGAKAAPAPVTFSSELRSVAQYAPTSFWCKSATPYVEVASERRLSDRRAASHGMYNAT